MVKGPRFLSQLCRFCSHSLFALRFGSDIEGGKGGRKSLRTLRYHWQYSARTGVLLAPRHDPTSPRSGARGGRMLPRPKAAAARRFRPSAAALDGARIYLPRASPPRPGPGHGKSSEAAGNQTARTGKVRKWSCSDSRGGRFIRRHGGGRLATHECERTLMHIVTTFACEIARAAAAERGATGGATEERDVRRALAHALGATAPGERAAKAKSAQPQPLHPSLVESIAP